MAVTAARPLLGFPITGSFVIEQFFATPGIGRQYVKAGHRRAYSGGVGGKGLPAVRVIGANTPVDIVYGLPEPPTPAGRT